MNWSTFFILGFFVFVIILFVNIESARVGYSKLCETHGYSLANSWDKNQVCCLKTQDVNLSNNEKFDLRCFDLPVIK